MTEQQPLRFKDDTEHIVLAKVTAGKCRQLITHVDVIETLLRDLVVEGQADTISEIIRVTLRDALNRFTEELISAIMHQLKNTVGIPSTIEQEMNRLQDEIRKEIINK